MICRTLRWNDSCRKIYEQARFQKRLIAEKKDRCSQVLLAQRTDNQTFFVVKIIQLGTQQGNHEALQVRRELEVGKYCQSKYTVHPFFLGEDKQRNCIYFVSRYAGRSLAQICNKRELSVPLIKKWVFQVLSGLHECHRRGTAHTDLTMENVVVDAEKKARMIDFGRAKTGSNPAYMALDFLHASNVFDKCFRAMSESSLHEHAKEQVIAAQASCKQLLNWIRRSPIEPGPEQIKLHHFFSIPSVQDVNPRGVAQYQ